MAAYYARRSFDYGAVPLDRGQLVELAGARNDEKLIRLGYLAEASEAGARPECGYCHARFIDDATLKGHGDFRHRDMTEDERDHAVDARMQREEHLAPLHLDQTAATLAGKPPALAGAGRRR